MFRTAATSCARATRTPAAIRSFHNSPVSRKTVTEKVSEVADKVNMKVGKGLASAIETGEKATTTAKEKIGSAAEETKSETEAVGRRTEQKAHQAAAGAREAKQDFEKEVRK